jgi:uncharacterized membrane protein
MNTILTKLAMLVFFLLAVTCAWAALTVAFKVSLINILLGVVAAFFLLRAFELADKINKLGPYAEQSEQNNRVMPDKEKHGSGKEISGDKVSPDEE